jgi:phosphoglycerate dehydrogenase-like enzyme
MQMVGIAVAPQPVPELMEAVERGGGRLVDVDTADAIVWTAPGGVAELAAVLGPRHRWVGLPIAGVEAWLGSGLIDDARLWTCAKGVYAAGVAEHAVALLLAGARRLPQTARTPRWGSAPGRRLSGTTTTVVGGGGIGREVARLLGPFATRLVAVNRSGNPVDGFETTAPWTELHAALADSDFVVLACALTAQTEHLIDAEALAALPEGAWVVNVARGRLVDTDALVAALREDRLGGAGLDVTDPEPLPEDHALWSFPNVLITPHVANPNTGVPWSSHLPELSEHVERNVRAFGRGEPLQGLIDVHAGY